jgi:hypothetical protein
VTKLFLFLAVMAMPAWSEEVTETELLRLFQLGACSGQDQLADEYDNKWVYAALDIAEFYNDATAQRSAVLEYGRGVGWLEGYATASQQLGVSREDLLSALKKEMPCEDVL